MEVQIPPSQIKGLLSVMPPNNDPKYLKHSALINDVIKTHNFKYVQIGPVSNILNMNYSVLTITIDIKAKKPLLQERLPH